MTMNCESVKENLGAWLDGELAAPEADRIKIHVEACPECAAEQKQLQQIQASLERILKLEAATVPFAAFWSGVEDRIARRVPWHLRLADRLSGVFAPARAAWAIPVAIVLVLGVLSLNRLLPEWPWAGTANIRTAVESIDAFGLNVAVFREHDTKTTVIWLFEDEEESPAEPAHGDDPIF